MKTQKPIEKTNKLYGVTKTIIIVKSPTLSMRNYSHTKKALYKKRKMIVESLNEASKKIEQELKFRYD